MTSGFDCDTEDGEKALAAMRRSADLAAFALAIPMRSDPGSRFAYCNCNNHLLSSIITATTGKSLFEFTQKNQFGPLGITDAIWPADPQGRTYGWGESASVSARYGETGASVPQSRTLEKCRDRAGELGERIKQGKRLCSRWCRLRIQLVVHFDENEIRIRMNETTGEVKDVMVDGLSEAHPDKKLEQQR